MTPLESLHSLIGEMEKGAEFFEEKESNGAKLGHGILELILPRLRSIASQLADSRTGREGKD